MASTTRTPARSPTLFIFRVLTTWISSRTTSPSWTTRRPRCAAGRTFPSSFSIYLNQVTCAESCKGNAWVPWFGVGRTAAAKGPEEAEDVRRHRSFDGRAADAGSRRVGKEQLRDNSHGPGQPDPPRSRRGRGIWHHDAPQKRCKRRRAGAAAAHRYPVRSEYPQEHRACYKRLGLRPQPSERRQDHT